MSERVAAVEIEPNEPKRPRLRSTARPKRAALSVPDASAGMLSRRLTVPAPHVVFVKGVIEASEGLAVVFAEQGGELTIAAPLEREAELAEVLRDLVIEVGGVVHDDAPDAGDRTL